MNLTQEEIEFANQRMQYYVNNIGLNQETASLLVNEELRERVLNQLKNKNPNKPSAVAKFIQEMYTADIKEPEINTQVIDILAPPT